MGTGTPPPPVIGDHCNKGDGILWPAGSTPKYVPISWTGVVTCPAAFHEAPDGKYFLKQDIHAPCMWWLITEKLYLEYEIGAVASQLQVQDASKGWIWYYFDTIVPPLSVDSTNELVICAPINPHGKLGTAQIHLP